MEEEQMPPPHRRGWARFVCSPRWRSGLLGVLAASSFTYSARTAELDLRGPVGCADREALAFRVSRLLGSALEAVPDMGLEVEVSSSRQGYEARLLVTDAAHAGSPSERRISESDCSRLMDALGVVIVLAIHREHGTPETAAPATTERAAPATAPSASSVVDRGTAEEPGEPPGKVVPSLSAWLLADLGALPEQSLGLGASFELTLQKLRLQASGVLFPDQHAVLEGWDSPEPGADVGLAFGALGACYALGGSWAAELALGPCVRAELGRLYGHGTNVRGARSGARWWIAPGLDLTGSWVPQGAFRVSTQLGVTTPLSRPPLELGELGELYRPAAVTFRAGLGLGVVLD